MIHLILGRQGGGKTILAVAKAYEKYLEGKTIYSNVALNFPYQQIKYKDIVNCKLNNGIVLLDEIHLLLPARNSMSKTSREICDGFLSMVRKKNLEIYGTTQTERKVDVRFREETDYYYKVKKFVFNARTKKWIEVLHNQDFSKDIPVIIQAEVLETFNDNTACISIIANKYYTMFDTLQIIKIEGLDK